MVNETYKTCLVCQENLPLNAFYRKADYWHSRCKSCVLQNRKQYYSQKLKARKPDILHIVINFYEANNNSNNIMTILESFLLEELNHEQRIER